MVLHSFILGTTIFPITNAWKLGIITNLTCAFINNIQFWSMCKTLRQMLWEIKRNM